MDNNQELAGILRDLVMLAMENTEVRAGNLTDADYQAHCKLVYERIEKAFPAE